MNMDVGRREIGEIEHFVEFNLDKSGIRFRICPKEGGHD